MIEFREIQYERHATKHIIIIIIRTVILKMSVPYLSKQPYNRKPHLEAGDRVSERTSQVNFPLPSLMAASYAADFRTIPSPELGTFLGYF